MTRFVFDLKDGLRDDKKKKDEFGGNGIYTGDRDEKVLKRDDSTSPFGLVIYVNEKLIPANKLNQAIVGVELRDHALSFKVVHADDSKKSALRRIYEDGIYALLQAVKLRVAKS